MFAVRRQRGTYLFIRTLSLLQVLCLIPAGQDSRPALLSECDGWQRHSLPRQADGPSAVRRKLVNTTQRRSAAPDADSHHGLPNSAPTTVYQLPNEDLPRSCAPTSMRGERCEHLQEAEGVSC